MYTWTCYCVHKTILAYRLRERQRLRGAAVKTAAQGWRDGSAVKSTDCSSRGPEFNSQKPHGGSQPSVMRSWALSWHAGVYTVFRTLNKNKS